MNIHRPHTSCWKAALAITLVLASVSTAAPDRRAVAEGAFDELVAQDFAALSERFTAQMRAGLPEERLASQVGPTIAALGALRSGRPVPRVNQAGENQVFVFPAEFEKAKINVVISVNAEGQVAGLFLRPPDPEPETAGDLSVVTGDIRLPATLELPEGEGPFPAVVLLHGSGPHDRDETIGPNTPFKDLAEGLALRGVATLRYVKRTKQYPQRRVATVQDEVVDDAVSALELLRQQSEIDAKRVYVLGHSLGGYLVPRVAQTDRGVAGFVLLAANARPMLELAREQVEYLGAPPEVLEQLQRSAPATYWEDLQAYDPVRETLEITGPVLILQGERDYQVTMTDFELWRTGLAGCENVTLRSYAKLNHLFVEGEGKSLPAEYSQPGHIPAYVLDDIAGFVKDGSIPRN